MESQQESLQDWFKQPAGHYILGLEKQLLDGLLPTYFGYYLLQIGGPGPAEMDMTTASPIHEKIFLKSSVSQECNLVGIPEDLPIEGNSIDVMIVTHVLEFSSDPHEVLREIERVLRPDGYVILFSFNPWGWYGLKRILRFRKSNRPSRSRYFSATRINDWLKLLGMSLVSQQGLGMLPLINNSVVLPFLVPLDRWFNRFSWIPIGSVNVIVAKKRVSTLTPIKPYWWQRLDLQKKNLAY